MHRDFAEWYSAGGRLSNPQHPDASGPVCATVAVPRCAREKLVNWFTVSYLRDELKTYFNHSTFDLI